MTGAKPGGDIRNDPKAKEAIDRATAAVGHEGQAMGGNASGDTPPDPEENKIKGFSSADPPKAPSGLSTGLQPSGTTPGGGPAASVGSLGTGGQTADAPSGAVKKGGR